MGLKGAIAKQSKQSLMISCLGIVPTVRTSDLAFTIY